MCNNGKNTNTSQFFFALAELPKLTGKHVVFGEIVSSVATTATATATPLYTVLHCSWCHQGAPPYAQTAAATMPAPRTLPRLSAGTFCWSEMACFDDVVVKPQVEGLEVVQLIEDAGTEATEGKPQVPVIIADCGVIE